MNTKFINRTPLGVFFRFPVFGGLTEIIGFPIMKGMKRGYRDEKTNGWNDTFDNDVGRSSAGICFYLSGAGLGRITEGKNQNGERNRF